MLWIGTRSGGLNRFDRERGVFTHYQNEPGNRASLSSNRVSAIYEDRAGTLWVGTRAGFARLDKQSGIFTRFQAEPGNPNSLSDNRVRAILEDRAGALWLGTSNGLNQFNRDRETTHVIGVAWLVCPMGEKLLPWIEFAEASVERSNPEHTGLVLEQRPDILTTQTAGNSGVVLVMLKRSVDAIEPIETVTGSNP